MKILFLSHYGAMLGANRSLLSMVVGMRNKGVEVMVYCPKEGPFIDELKKLKIPHEVVPYKNWADTFLLPGYWLLPLRYFQNQRLLPALFEKVKTFHPDIIHTNSSVLGIGAHLAERLSIPHVWHIRELPRLHYNMRYFPGKAHFYKYLSKAKKLIVISEKVRDEVIGKRDLPYQLVYNGVAPLSHFDQPPTTFAKKDAPDQVTFLMIGMLHPNKGQLLALKAFNKVATKFKQARLLIVGKGRRIYEKELKSFCQKNKLNEQVEFAGYFPDPKEAYLRSDVVLMCSKNEAMGRVTVEAMAYAKPVIGYKSGGTPELITDGHDGFIFENGADELAKRMQYFLENPSAIKTIGDNGFASAKEKYTIDSYVDKMYAIFAAILDARY